MTRSIIFYGSILAVLVVTLKLLQFRFLVQDLSVQIYIGAIALIFVGIGIWAGTKLTRKKVVTVRSKPFVLDQQRLEQFGISKREYEVLDLMAKGLSNQEIADNMFLSLNTVKTHTSNLFQKLDAKRRTQAIQKAKELSLLP